MAKEALDGRAYGFVGPLCPRLLQPRDCFLGAFDMD